MIYLSSPINWPNFKPLAQVLFEMGHNSRKGDNSDKKKKIWVSYFSMRNPYMKFKTWACTVHKIWHTSDFILIFSKGHNSRKGDNSDKLYMSSIFPWGNNMWNFKTLACTVLEKRMDGRMHWQPKLICPVTFYEFGGIMITRVRSSITGLDGRNRKTVEIVTHLLDFPLRIFQLKSL